MKCTLFIILFATSVSTFAQDKFLELKNRNPNSTPFEILKHLYDESQRPAVLNDFERYTSPNNQECGIASPNDSWPRLFRPVRVLIGKKGNESRGPLFPPTLDLSKEVILFGDDVLRRYKHGELSFIYNLISVDTDKTDLVQKYVEENGHVYHLLLARKNANLLAVKLTIDAATSYAYCYHK